MFQVFDNFDVPMTIWYTYRALNSCLTLSSLLTFLVISIDRWIVLVFPLQARAWRTRRLVYAMLVAVWALSLTGGALMLAADLHYINWVVFSIVQPLFLFIPLLTMFVLWGFIARIAIRSSTNSTRSRTCSKVKNEMELKSQMSTAGARYSNFKKKSRSFKENESRSGDIMIAKEEIQVASISKDPPEELDTIHCSLEEAVQLRRPAHIDAGHLNCEFGVALESLNCNRSNRMLSCVPKIAARTENRAAITSATIIGYFVKYIC